MIVKKIITILLFSFVGLLAFSQTNADIVGEWYNAEKDAVITLFEENETVSGKITWMESPNDDNGNPCVGVSCQGLEASVWWPCKDHQSDEPDSMRITYTAR